MNIQEFLEDALSKLTAIQALAKKKAENIHSISTSETTQENTRVTEISVEQTPKEEDSCSKSSPDNLSIPPLSSNSKKSIQRKKSCRTFNYGPWTPQEETQYKKFILSFDNKHPSWSTAGPHKKRMNYFIEMSKFVGTRSPEQCRSHDQKRRNHYLNIVKEEEKPEKKMINHKSRNISKENSYLDSREQSCLSKDHCEVIKENLNNPIQIFEEIHHATFKSSNQNLFMEKKSETSNEVLFLHRMRKKLLDLTRELDLHD